MSSMPPSLRTDPLHRLDRSDVALLVIDPQEKLLPAVVEPDRVVGAVRLLLRAARVLGLPVVATTQYERGLGPLVKPIAELLPEGTQRLEKTAFSCFDADGFADLLAAAAPGRRTLVVAGIESHICVAGTVLGALRRGLAVEVVTDAVSSRAVADHAVGVGRMEAAGALATTAEMAVYELLGGSGTAAFKELLPAFKERAR